MGWPGSHNFSEAGFYYGQQAVFQGQPLVVLNLLLGGGPEM